MKVVGNFLVSMAWSSAAANNNGRITNSIDGFDAGDLEASSGSSLVSITSRQRSTSLKGPFAVQDPRTKQVQNWNRFHIWSRLFALAIDTLFFYTLSIGIYGAPCLYLHTGLAMIVTVLRTSIDGFQLFYICSQFRVAYKSRSLVVGGGELVWDSRAIVFHYVRSLKGFWFDVLVILPLPQILVWMVVPRLIKDNQTQFLMTLLLGFFLLHFLPRVYHCVALMKRMCDANGYVFGNIWSALAMNLVAYVIAAHVVGGCWYTVAVERVASCVKQQCQAMEDCTLKLACPRETCSYLQCQSNMVPFPNLHPICLSPVSYFAFGIYKEALTVISSDSVLMKIIYPFYWGFVTLSTLGNGLQPSKSLSEVTFCILVILFRLVLVAMLFGNIKALVDIIRMRKRTIHQRWTDVELWMRRRELPKTLKERVRGFERERSAAIGGDEEMKLLNTLPHGLRRDIKRCLCFDLVKKVPFFKSLDDYILDHLCDRLKPLLYTSGEKIIRKGQPVDEMIFVIGGLIESTNGMVRTGSLGPGDFSGEELLLWSLRRRFEDPLPASSATLLCMETTEVFGLEADDLCNLTERFQYKFATQSFKRTARYYSPNWRTWGALNIQFAWNRYKLRARGRPAATQEMEYGDSNERILRQCAAMFSSLRPHDHLD
ncbi:hypothetical protein MKW92_041216 [Papaver armeniacum]|nr:hypothetical protein MKW92_041216 [Papaver armeniacum]